MCGVLPVFLNLLFLGFSRSLITNVELSSCGNFSLVCYKQSKFRCISVGQATWRPRLPHFKKVGWSSYHGGQVSIPRESVFKLGFPEKMQKQLVPSGIRTRHL